MPVQMKSYGPASNLADKLNSITGLAIAVKEVRSEPARRSIFLTLSDADRNLGEEGYTLTITRQQVKLSAVKPAGISEAFKPSAR
jgi:hypothetical protein